ncbi:MFS transporter [Vibrio cholerae]|nr:MFS transporter [Vibrio cholerae]EIF8947869.1 MFS transporter [Vibrio cholerae]EJL6474127.1 MFS transporter [Vibrio cholerae]EKF9422461.1 MFS transporter [Vibrio cholerae]EKF9440534.1 MFS transporter [Vibrio cholerae]
MQKMFNSRIIVGYGVAFNSFRMLVGAIAAIYMINQGLSIYEVGIIKSIQAMVILFVDIPLSYVADKFSRKFSIALSTLLGSVWLTFMWIGSDFNSFLIAEVFNALSLSLIGGAYLAYLIDNSESSSEADIKKITASYSKYHFFFVGFSGFAGGILYNYIGAYLWALAAALCLVLFFCSFLLPSDKNHSNAGKKNRTSLFQDIRAIYIEICSEGTVIVILISGLLFVSLYYQILIQIWQPYVVSGFGSLSNEGILFGVLFLIIQLSQSITSWFIEKLKNINLVFIFGMALSATSTILLINGGSWTTMVAVIVIFCANLMMRNFFSIKFQALISPSFRSTIDSLFSTMMRIVLIISLPLSGNAIDTIGWEVMTALFVGSYVMAFTAYTMLPKNEVRKVYEQEP